MRNGLIGVNEKCSVVRFGSHMQCSGRGSRDVSASCAPHEEILICSCEGQVHARASDELALIAESYIYLAFGPKLTDGDKRVSK